MESFDSWIKNTPIACRGICTDTEPENSLGAIKNAMDKGYGVMIDVRTTLDNVIVVFKDETLGRMTGTDGFVTNSKFDDIKDLKLNKSTQTIPTLEQVIELVDGKVPIIVELKNMDKISWEKYVWKILSSYKGEFAVASNNPYSLEWFKDNAPTARRGQISSFYKNSNLPFGVRYRFKRMKYNDISEPNFIIYKCEDLPNRFVKKFKELPLLAYHVNSKEKYDKVKKHVDNVIFENFEL